MYHRYERVETINRTHVKATFHLMISMHGQRAMGKNSKE